VSIPLPLTHTGIDIPVNCRVLRPVTPSNGGRESHDTVSPTSPGQATVYGTCTCTSSGSADAAPSSLQRFPRQKSSADRQRTVGRPPLLHSTFRICHRDSPAYCGTMTTVYVDLMSQPSRACTLFCRQVLQRTPYVTQVSTQLQLIASSSVYLPLAQPLTRFSLLPQGRRPAC
jgi:hypothetical protein